MSANSHQRSVPRAVSVGAILALLAVFFGFGLGGVFGANEAAIKGKLADSGNAALATVYQGDTAKKDAVVSKSWSYMKRAHLHGGAIGAAALASIGALVLLTGLGVLAQVSAVAFGAGGLFYGLFWLMAGFAAPGLGGTDAAKAAYEWIAVPGAGLSMIGVVGSLVSIAKDSLFAKPAASASTQERQTV